MSQRRPRFSLVSAAYNVSAYLPEFIASVEAQAGGIDDVEVVMVDDGSSDSTVAILEAWAARNPAVRVVSQENAGQGPARNRGMAEATGEWITFPDPDDVLTVNYLAAVRGFLDAHDEVDMVATRRVMWDEATGVIKDGHPLRFMFKGDQLVNLGHNPERFHGASNTSFFQLDRLREGGVRFDPRVRPNFEDGHFNAHYLLRHEPPLVGFVSSAVYRYRQRADNSSTLQTAKRDRRRYTDVFEHGYLEVAQHARATYGFVPGWLTSFLVYELGWYFADPDSVTPTPATEDPEVSARFHELFAEVLATFDVQQAMLFASPSIRPNARRVLHHAYTTWHQEFVQYERLDEDEAQVRVSYFFTGDRPVEKWLVDGEPWTPAHIKDRVLEFAGKVVMRQRIAWLPADRTTRLTLNGAPMDIKYEVVTEPVAFAPPGQVRWWLNPESGRARRAIPARVLPKQPLSKRGRWAMRRAAGATKYAGAWVFVDRVHDALDSAEILFRHVRDNHPDINAWFVLEKGGAEWKRFKAEGHGDRLVAYGSMEWMLLMANAAHLLSSHADAAVVAPREVLEFTYKTWRFHFLQHGVIKDDLSAWLNPKDLDTFVTSTRAEYDSIVGDDTPYRYTSRETILSGLPRFDRLLKAGERFPADRRDLLLVAPTWRDSLTPAPAPGSQRREVTPELLGSEFMRQWLAFLTDERVARACAEHGLTLGFLPHPNLQPALPLLDLPAHVTPLSYHGQDVQELFARARMMVTDFSSTAFNAAYLDRPVVYFQFDEAEVFGGSHVGKRGYFDYRKHGYGPVATTLDDAVGGVVDGLAHGPDPAEPYLSRIRDSFPERDGQCSERVVQHVLRCGTKGR
ncbi:MAG TPA: CDP-glycerol glycerophosphotransferase family protein [Nocardioides sp.]|nr:CDP-glycerol glycerophosphotransferase family protein [Nocardioides sp.]